MKRLVGNWRDGALWRDILLVLLVKCVVLYLIGSLFFSHPLARHMTVPVDLVGTHLTGTDGPDSTGENHVARP